MTYPAAPRVACSWAPTDQTRPDQGNLPGQAWMVGTAMTRYVALAAQTRSSMDQAMTSSTPGRAMTMCTQIRAKTSSMAGMVTICLLPMTVMGGGTSSIAVLAGTN